MEDFNIIREKHGIANVRKITSVDDRTTDTQSVNVVDGFGEVVLTLSSNFPGALTPDQANMLADQLRASAIRVQNNKDHK